MKGPRTAELDATLRTIFLDFVRNLWSMVHLPQDQRSTDEPFKGVQGAKSGSGALPVSVAAVVHSVVEVREDNIGLSAFRLSIVDQTASPGHEPRDGGHCERSSEAGNPVRYGARAIVRATGLVDHRPRWLLANRVG